MARPKMENEADRKHALSVTLTKKQIEFLKRLGKGNASNGVRSLIDIMKSNAYKARKQGGENEKKDVNR